MGVAETDLDKYFGVGPASDPDPDTDPGSDPDDLSPAPPPGQRQAAAAAEDVPREPEEEPTPAPAPASEEPTEPPADEPPADDEPPPSGVQVGDRTLSETEAQDAVALLEWRNNLRPQEIDALNRLYSGDHVLISAEEYRQLQAGTVSPTTPTSTPPSEPSPSDDDFLDPRAAEEIRRLRSELSEVRQTTDTISQQTHEQQQAALANALSAARDQFSSSHSLSDEEVQRVENHLSSMGIVPALQQRYQDPEKALLEGYKLAYRSMDEFLDREVNTRLESLQSEEDERKTRRRKASAVSGSGGSVPRDGAAEPKTRQERDKAIVDTIRSAMRKETA